MAYDQHKNLAISTVVTPPSPPVSGNTLIVAVGDGALFPAAPFNAVVYPSNTGPTVANAEFVRVTAKVGETFTILRTQESSSARSIQVGDRIADSITVRDLTDVENYAGIDVVRSGAILEPGILGQRRAGRVLTALDFTTLLGLAAPTGLYNLADVGDASGNGRVLTNKGTVTFGSGILGLTPEAALFTGSTAQALYIADTGAADPFRIPYGTWGCWFRTAKTGTEQALISKVATGAAANSTWFWLEISSGNALTAYSNGQLTLGGYTNVCDDRWHHAVATWDGATLSIYLDGVLEAQRSGSVAAATVAGVLNIGGYGADGATAASAPMFGRIDEAFVTPDVLSADQVRMLYAAKVAHGQTLYVPTQAKVAVRRQRRGAALATADFSATPLHLYNFTGAALTDLGSLSLPLTNNNAALPAPGADGAQGNAYNFVGASSQSLSSSDAGLPAGTAARSFGCWFKASVANAYFLSYGTVTTGEMSLGLGGGGEISWFDGANNLVIPGYNDGQWHFVVVVIDNAAADGLKVKIYADGKLIKAGTGLQATVLGGSARIGSRANASAFYSGQIDAVFYTAYAMTSDEIAKVYAKGSQPLAPSPKNPGAHVEGLDATYAYLIADTLDSQHLLDLEVAA